MVNLFYQYLYKTLAVNEKLNCGLKFTVWQLKYNKQGSEHDKKLKNIKMHKRQKKKKIVGEKTQNCIKITEQSHTRSGKHCTSKTV